MRVFYGEKGYLAGKSGDDLADIKAGLAGYGLILVSAKARVSSDNLHKP